MNDDNSVIFTKRANVHVLFVFVFSEKGRITGQISLDESIRAHAYLVGDSTFTR